MTPLDHAHAAMEAAPGDGRARLAFYEALIEGELVVLLAHEPAADEAPQPAQFPTAEGRLVLAFENEERLAAFTGAPAPFAALPGRALVRTLAGQGLGLGLNLGAPSEYLLPAATLDWLAGMLARPHPRGSAQPSTLDAPRLPEALLDALRRKLGQAAGLASHVLLAAVEWPDDEAQPRAGARADGGAGRQGHLLAFVGAAPGAEAALAQGVGEALAFSGLADSDPQAAAGLDVLFLPSGAPLLEPLARVALRLDLPAAPAAPERAPAGPPGPPRLR